MTAPARLANVPNQPRRKSPRNFRVRDELYDGAKAAAAFRGETLSEHVLRPALRDYQDDPEKWSAEHPPDKED